REVRPVATSGVLLESPSLTDEDSPFVKRATSVLPRSPKEVSRLKRRFMQAGYHTMTPLAAFTVAQLTLCVTLAGLALMTLSPPLAWIVAGLGAFIGWNGPSFGLDYLVGKRQKQIRNGLPDALDLMIVCLEAGSSIDQSIVKVSDELGI